MYFQKINLFKSSNKFDDGGGAGLNCLPIDPMQTPKGFRMIMMNTHIFNILQQSFAPSVSMGVISAILAKSAAYFLPVFLVGFGVSAAIPLSTQADARDIGLVKKDSFDPFWPEEELLKVDVLAVNDGEVVETFNQIRNHDKYIRQSLNTGGNSIIISHKDGLYYSYYAHLSYNSLKVKKGDKVKKGQPIAKCGDTGNSSAPHLHFEMTWTKPGDIGIFKPLSNFVPYKYTPIPWKELLLSGKEFSELLQDYYKKPLIIDKSGCLDSFAYIS